MDRMLVCIVSLSVLLALYTVYRWLVTTREKFVDSKQKKNNKTILENISAVLNNIKDRTSSVISDNMGADDDEAINNSA